LNTELLPAFGLPRTATVPAAFRWIAMRSTGTIVSAGAAIRHHVKPLRLLVTQRDRRAENPHLERIPAQRAPQEGQLRPLDEAEHHQALDVGICGFDGLDASPVAGLEVRECQKFAPGAAA